MENGSHLPNKRQQAVLYQYWIRFRRAGFAAGKLPTGPLIESSSGPFAACLPLPLIVYLEMMPPNCCLCSRGVETGDPAN